MFPGSVSANARKDSKNNDNYKIFKESRILLVISNFGVGGGGVGVLPYMC